MKQRADALCMELRSKWEPQSDASAEQRAWIARYHPDDSSLHNHRGNLFYSIGLVFMAGKSMQSLPENQQSEIAELCDALLVPFERLQLKAKKMYDTTPR
jgi:hypothetical protein